MSTKLNVLEHVMVPDHKIMSEEEVSDIILHLQNHKRTPAKNIS